MDRGPARAVTMSWPLLLALDGGAATQEQTIARQEVGLPALRGRRVRRDVEDEGGLQRQVGTHDWAVRAGLAVDAELDESRRLRARDHRRLVDAVDQRIRVDAGVLVLELFEGGVGLPADLGRRVVRARRQGGVEDVA